ncbi:hypothetical protein GGX14DRAFT_409133 [Mycena pura]|uniref:Uncharacterized protein n=1 Tax=Mycena pura TaxID=153505 RepID=A0AAD6URP4_9AGAR|nr:hypothetical protein GGX14DRAFT_409133 [Mycena pura]
MSQQYAYWDPLEVGTRVKPARVDEICLFRKDDSGGGVRELPAPLPIGGARALDAASDEDHPEDVPAAERIELTDDGAAGVRQPACTRTLPSTTSPQNESLSLFGNQGSREPTAYSLTPPSTALPSVSLRPTLAPKLPRPWWPMRPDGGHQRPCPHAVDQGAHARQTVAPRAADGGVADRGRARQTACPRAAELARGRSSATYVLAAKSTHEFHEHGREMDLGAEKGRAMVSISPSMNTMVLHFHPRIPWTVLDTIDTMPKTDIN